jgi:hypothetical protein
VRTSFCLLIEFVVRRGGAGASADQSAKLLLGFTASRFSRHSLRFEPRFGRENMACLQLEVADRDKESQGQRKMARDRDILAMEYDDYDNDDEEHI